MRGNGISDFLENSSFILPIYRRFWIDFNAVGILGTVPNKHGPKSNLLGRTAI